MKNQLTSLARETSGDKRGKLMRSVAYFFVSHAGDYSDRELYLFGEVLTGLLDSVNRKDREQLSRAVAVIKQTPHNLAIALAQDKISVAKSILELSPVLNDDDLVTIASSGATGHRLAVSKRANLSTSVTDALIIHGEKSVMCSVAGNVTAKISNEGFDQLVRHAENYSDLSQRLALRSDLSVQLLKRIIPLVPSRARKRLVALLDSDGDEVVHNLIEEGGQLAKVAVLDNKKERLDARMLLKDIRAGRRQLDTVIKFLADEDRPKDVGIILASTATISENFVSSALMNMNGQTIAVLCRSLDISDKAFAAIAAMRCKRLQLPSSMADRLSEQFAAIDLETAHRTMRFSKVRNSLATA